MSEKVLEQKVDKARPVPEQGPPSLPSEAEIRVTIGEKTEGPKGICYLRQSVQFSSVTLCDPKDCSMPGLPVHH